MTNRPPLPIPDSYWVKPGQFLAGEYPGRAERGLSEARLLGFLHAGINTFVDLTHPGELSPYEPLLKEAAGSLGVDPYYVRMPIRDHDVPSPAEMKSILDEIDRALAAGRSVYVHCWGGVGRTGTTVGCYLVRHGLSGQQALSRLGGWWQAIPKRAYFPSSPETPEQVQFVLNWRETGIRGG